MSKLDLSKACMSGAVSNLVKFQCSAPASEYRKMWPKNIILFLLLFSSSAGAAQNNVCDTTTVLNKFSHWVESIETYSLALKVKIANDPTEIRSKLSGIKGKRLKIELTTTTDKYTASQLALFDGKTQWVESNSPFGVQVVKLNLDKLTKPESPFDTSFYLMGAGLINGEDFPATLKVMLSVYDFDVHCKNNDEIILRGKINKHHFTDYIKHGRYAKNKLKTVDRFAKEFGVLTIKLGHDAQILKEYGFGTLEGTQINHVVLNGSFNQPISGDHFHYVRPENSEITDITDDILSSLAN